MLTLLRRNLLAVEFEFHAAAKAIPVVPGLPLVVFFLRSRRCSYRRRLQCLAPESTSRALFSLAGFQVTLIGRFWVTAEGTMGKKKTKKQSAKATLAEVIKEMAKPRVARSVLVVENDI